MEIRNDANRRWARGGIRIWFKCGRVSLVTSWTREHARQDRAAGSASGREKYLNPSCADIRIRIDVSSDTCLHRELLYSSKRARWKVRGSCGREKKYSNFSTDRHEPDVTIPLSYGIWANDLFTLHGERASYLYERWDDYKNILHNTPILKIQFIRLFFWNLIGDNNYTFNYL